MAATEEDGPWGDFKPSTAVQHSDDDGPWSEFVQATREATEALPPPHTSSQLKSGAQGFAQGATFGFSDEALAAAKAAYDKLKEGGGTLTGNTSFGDFYNKRIAQEREDLRQAREDFPKTYMAGNLGGAIASNALPGVGIARGAGLGTTLAKAALQGGLVGAGESIGKDQGEVLRDTAKGAATGAAMQGVFSGLSGIASRVTPQALSHFAEERAVKAAVGPNVNVLRNAIGTTTRGANPEYVSQRISKMGRDILDEDVLRALSKTEDLGPGLLEASKKYGTQIGEIGKTIDEQLPNAINTQKIASELADYAATIPPTVGGKKLQERLLSEAANFEEMPALGFGQAQAIKNQFKYKPVDPDALISNQDVSNKVRQIIGKNMEEATENVAKTSPQDIKDLLSRYQDVKGKYATFKNASNAVGNEQAKDLMRRVVSPSDYATGIGTGAVGALATGHPGVAAIGILGAAANKFARERGSSTAAVIADSLSKKLEASPSFAKSFGQILMDAAQRGPAAMTATHLMLMRNPAYAQEFEDQPVSLGPRTGI